jgi:phosphoadenosine phosphosulfate reductase
MSDVVQQLTDLPASNTEQLIKRVTHQFQERLVLAMSFSREDIVLLDLLLERGFSGRVIALDTGRLPEETYQLADEVKQHFQVEIEWYFPAAEEVEQLLRKQGSHSFRIGVNERKECCRVRKVAPLKRALVGASAWVTGQRREHSSTREHLPIVERDGLNAALIKLNPLADWSHQRVQEHTEQRGLPYNQLYDAGYVSIGCAPCSRAVVVGEDLRSGRWWWEEPEQKEC